MHPGEPDFSQQLQWWTRNVSQCGIKVRLQKETGTQTQMRNRTKLHNHVYIKRTTYIIHRNCNHSLPAPQDKDTTASLTSAYYTNQSINNQHKKLWNSLEQGNVKLQNHLSRLGVLCSCQTYDHKKAHCVVNLHWRKFEDPLVNFM